MWALMNIVVVLILNCAVSVNTIYFRMNANGRKCFIEDIPSDTNVIGIFKVDVRDRSTGEYMTPATGYEIQVDIREPGNYVLQDKIYSHEGKFKFNSWIPGEHVICFNSISTAWLDLQKYRVYLDIKTGERTVDYVEVIKKNNLTSRKELFVQRLLYQAEDLANYFKYQRVREKWFREECSYTSTLVFWWSVIHIALVILTIKLTALIVDKENENLSIQSHNDDKPAVEKDAVREPHLEVRSRYGTMSIKSDSSNHITLTV